MDIGDPSSFIISLTSSGVELSPDEDHCPDGAAKGASPHLTQRKISITSELIADSSPIRHALFRQINNNDNNHDSDLHDDLECTNHAVFESYHNTNYGTTESNEMATIDEVDASLNQAAERVFPKMEEIVHIQSLQPSEKESTNTMAGVLDVLNLLTCRVDMLEENVAMLRSKLKKSYVVSRTSICHSQRKARRPKRSAIPIVKSSGDDRVSVDNSSGSVWSRKQLAEFQQMQLNPDDAKCREIREVREFRMNRFHYRKTRESERLNQRPVRRFVVPEARSDAPKTKVIRPRFRSLLEYSS